MPAFSKETTMDLLLWRHAEAEDGEDDLKRRLTDRGEKQARVMAKWIREHQPKDLRIIVSPRCARSRLPRRLNCLLKLSARLVRRLAFPS
jgi:broad specificity phosphatase PhoE